MRRVVITGVGVLSPLGNDMQELQEGLESSRSGVVHVESWSEYKDFKTRVCGLVNWDDYKVIPRKSRRSMGRVAIMAAKTMQDAVKDAG
ncbi:MAG: beta-ketoacyl synthase N-terminal-like domain-containing protein, partial [Sulfurimonadaceae bacterium]